MLRAHHERTHFSSTLTNLEMSAVKETRLGEQRTSWQYHVDSAVGGMQVVVVDGGRMEASVGT